MKQETLHLDRVRVTIDDGVAEVALARPDKMNALDSAMFEALGRTIDQLKTDPGVHAVVLRGEGRLFCAGIDLASLGGLVESGELPPHLRELATRTHGQCNLFQYVAWGWQELKVPVIAALHGAAFGGGLQIALGADIRLVQADTKLSVMEIQWGLIPDMAGCALLPRLVRDDVARELTFTGRVVLGEEAARLGLATRVCDDPLAEARAMARQMAGRLPEALQAAKQLLNLAHTADTASVLKAEAVAQQALLGSPAQVELLRAGFKKR
jgi:enoyl-CoA hydratase/carnithine racemase